MAQDSKSRKLDQYIVRFPDGMRDRLKDTAAANERSLNAEIVERLKWTLGPALKEWDEMDEKLQVTESRAIEAEARYRAAEDARNDLAMRNRALFQENSLLKDANSQHFDRILEQEREISQLHAERNGSENRQNNSEMAALSDQVAALRKSLLGDVAVSILIPAAVIPSSAANSIDPLREAAGAVLSSYPNRLQEWQAANEDIVITLAMRVSKD